MTGENVLQDIRLCPCADLVVTIRNATPPPALSFSQRLARKWRSLLYSWYTAWDDAKYATPEDPLVMCDAKRILGTVSVIDVVPRMTLHTDRFEDDDIRRIRELDLDVILRFGFRLLRGAILDSARYGVWSYHHGDNSVSLLWSNGSCLGSQDSTGMLWDSATIRASEASGCISAWSRRTRHSHRPSAFLGTI
jgi:hypothetical protein